MASDSQSLAVRRALFFTGLVVLAEPLAATMLLSFVVFMVRDFPAVNERSVAFWCGVISKTIAHDLRSPLESADTALTASAFFVAQVFTAPLYGAVSDRLGRKPVLLFGLIGSAVCTVLYGISGNLAMAIISRALCGFFNGTENTSSSSWSWLNAFYARQRWCLQNVSGRVCSQQRCPPRSRVLDIWTLYSDGYPLGASSRRLPVSTHREVRLHGAGWDFCSISISTSLRYQCMLQHHCRSPLHSLFGGD